MGVPCWQACWQREPAAFKALVLSDPVMPHLGMDPKEVIKDSHRGILTYKDGRSSVIAKGKDHPDNGTQPGAALRWDTMWMSKCRHLEAGPMTWGDACNATVKEVKLGKCVWSSSTAGKEPVLEHLHGTSPRWTHTQMPGDL